MSMPFHPRVGSTVSLPVTAISANVLLVNPSKGKFQLRVYNLGTKEAFFRQGTDNTVAAVATTDTPLAPGELEVFTINSDPASPVTYVAAICGGTDTTTLRFSVGEGL